MTTKILAVDPGCSGGFAWRDDGKGLCKAMPDTEGDVLDILRTHRAAGIEVIYIEDQVGVMGPGIRVASSAMFTFGRGFGFILGAAQALGYRIVRVRPMNWQKALATGKKKDYGTKWKAHLKALAQERFPNTDGITLKTADALLLLDYAEWVSKVEVD